MAKRLSEVYKVKDMVEIQFGEDLWLVGRVAGFQHPGLWVTTADGASWYVTNGRRIRKKAGDGDAATRP